MSADDPPVPTSVRDPSILSLPYNCSSDADVEGCASIRRFSSILFKEIEQTAVPDASNESETLRLIKFMGQGNDSRIVEALYSARTINNDEYGEFVPTDSISPMAGKNPVTVLSSTRAGDDDFVVDDDYGPAVVSRVTSRCREARRAQHAEKWLDQHATISAAVRGFLVNKTSGTQRFNDWLGSMSTMLRDSIHDGPDPTLPRTMFVRPLLHLSGSRLISLGSISLRNFLPLTILKKTQASLRPCLWTFLV